MIDVSNAFCVFVNDCLNDTDCRHCGYGKMLNKAYQQGRVDAIDDVLQKMKELKLDEYCPSGCHCSAEQESCPYNECTNDAIYILDQLKGEKVNEIRRLHS